MVDKDSLKEVGLIVALSLALFFISTNVNPSLGNIYHILAVLGICMILADNAFGRREIKLINKNINWGTAIFIAGIAYVILIFASYFANSLSKVIPLTELLNLLSSSAPVYASSQSINFIIFAVIVPIIETMVIFCLAIDLFASLFNISLNKFSGKLFFLFLILSFAFLLFHVTAKSTSNEAALILVFIMAMITCFLIFFWKESRIPILFHIFCNLVASLSIFSNFLS